MRHARGHQRDPAGGAAARPGQALVEFALVLPVLVVVGFGTLQAAMFYQRAIALSGAAFLADRAAAVQGPRADDAAREVVHAYAAELARPGQPPAPWVEQLVRHVDRQPDRVQVTLEDRHEAWAALLTAALAATGAATRSPLVLAAAAAMPQEFVPSPEGGLHSATQQETSHLVDYTAKLGLLDPISKDPLFVALRGILPGGGGVALGFDPTVQAYPPNAWRTQLGNERAGIHPNPHDYVSAENDSVTPGPAQVESGIRAAGATVAGLQAGGVLAPQLRAVLGVVGQAGAQNLAQVERTLDAGARAFFEATAP